MLRKMGTDSRGTERWRQRQREGRKFEVANPAHLFPLAPKPTHLGLLSLPASFLYLYPPTA